MITYEVWHPVNQKVGKVTNVFMVVQRLCTRKKELFMDIFQSCQRDRKPHEYQVMQGEILSRVT